MLIGGICGSILILISITCYACLASKLSVYRFKKRHHATHTMYQLLYRDSSGHRLSLQARDDKAYRCISYVYGEIDFLPFVSLLSLVRMNADSVFYDLGSGTGKAVMSCAMTYQPKYAIGIEIIEPLHNEAQRILQRSIIKQMPGAQKVRFIHDNFLNTNLENATHIFINASAFFGDIWIRINTWLTSSTTTPIIITTSKPLSSLKFQVTHQTYVQMSWGIVRAYIHEVKDKSYNYLSAQDH